MSPRQCLTDGCLYPAAKGGARFKERCGGGVWDWSKPMGAGWGSMRAAHLRIKPGCRVCGRPAVTVDHIVARAFGGTNDERNLQSLCRVHADVKNHRDRELGKKLKKERYG
jgi:5-methylcytosine-specific restriction endonuclease McrA